jgi:ferredoxin
MPATDDPPTPHPAGDTTTSGILDVLAAEGFGASFAAMEDPPGTLRCGACGTASPSAAFDVHEERRLEGASDPDDMVLVVAATCPYCGAGGAVVLGFGPGASGADSDVVASLGRSG